MNTSSMNVMCMIARNDQEKKFKRTLDSFRCRSIDGFHFFIVASIEIIIYGILSRLKCKNNNDG